jgi:hypothetical protein
VASESNRIRFKPDYAPMRDEPFRQNEVRPAAQQAHSCIWSVIIQNQGIFWAGVKYAVTPTFDVVGAYYGIRQGFYLIGAGPGAAGNPTFSNVPGGPVANGSQAAACATLGTNSPGCSGTLDMFSLAMDWRFARHFDFYAGKNSPSIGPSRSIGDKERFCKPKVESSILSTGTGEIHSLAYAEFGTTRSKSCGTASKSKIFGSLISAMMTRRKNRLGLGRPPEPKARNSPSRSLATLDLDWYQGVGRRRGQI